MSNQGKILLVDDHPLVREWLANLINQEPHFKTCGEAGSASEALELIARAEPTIVVVDISLENGSGLELIKDVHALHPEIATIVLSMHDEMLYAERAMRAGARGYVMKREATDKILDALQCVLQGGAYFSNLVNAMMAQKFVSGAPQGSHSPVASLSDRELEVFELLGRGQNTRQISAQLKLSFKTTQVYCGRIKEKLNLVNVNELIAQAVRWYESQHAK